MPARGRGWPRRASSRRRPAVRRKTSARAVFCPTETVVFGGPAKRRVAPSTDSASGELLDDDAARAVLERQLPGFGADSPLGLALVQLAGFAPAQIPGGTPRAIAADAGRVG
jgi:hypothetical protein